MTHVRSLSHCLNQFRQFSELEVTKQQFTSRISACERCQYRSDVYCNQYKKKCADYSKQKSNWCNQWGESHPVIPRKSKIKNIVVLTTYFNPTKNGNQEKNFRTFMARLGSPVIVVELSFDGNFLSDHSIQLKGDVQKHLLWQKESMLNIAIENLPDDVDAVVWIDSDLIFENPNWLEETKLQLETYDLVQMYDCVNYIRADGQIEKSIPSFGKCSVDGNKEEGSPGGAWAARRELLVDGLYDKRITGGGDSEQLRRWISQKLSIGYTSGTLQHL